MNTPIEWLLAGQPWIEYRTRLDLLGGSESDPLVAAAHRSMLADPQVGAVIQELTAWPWAVIASHKSAGQPFHKLTFLADLGLQAGDPQMEGILARILEHPADEGPFQLPVNIPTHFGGTGREQWAWALCDAPLMVYALARFGLRSDRKVQSAAQYLAGLVRDNGWPCAVSKELGKFRGPGRREDPCPFANLAMLKALSEFPEWRESQACRVGAETQLGLWEASSARHPYMFFMGTDFRKLKVPFIWYDLMHVLEVLSRFPWLRQDPRLLEMLAFLEGRMEPDGRFRLESVWTAWKGWEFGQKKEPSRWLTLSAWRIITRMKQPPLEKLP